ncbi:MAG: type I-D CRISPR-associated protein Cas7/Csc2 [Thermonemataceae bacterium]
MQALFNLIPKAYFVENLKQNRLGTLKIALLREIVGNAIIRSNYPDETITFKLSENKDIVEVPARKLKSREKLLGLKMCREFDVVDPSLRYNVIKKSEQLANPNSILFGDSVTESGDSVALTSRVIYDWAYSIRDIEQITSTLQHNALSEGGTMWNEEEGSLRQSLFQVQYVKPGTYLPHFVMVENVTPALFLHLVACIMYESRYFAQSTTNSTSNVKNHLIGVGYAKFEQPVNSYTITKNWETQMPVNFNTVSQVMRDTMIEAYGEQHFVEGTSITALVTKLWQEEDTLSTIYKQAEADSIQFLKDIKITK